MLPLLIILKNSYIYDVLVVFLSHGDFDTYCVLRWSSISQFIAGISHMTVYGNASLARSSASQRIF